MEWIIKAAASIYRTSVQSYAYKGTIYNGVSTETYSFRVLD